MFRRVIVLYWCAVAFNVASTMEASQPSNLHMIFSSVLGRIPFEFQEDKEKIYITTNPDNADKTSRVLTEAVSSRDGFLKHFSGKTSLEISSDKVDALPFSSFCGEKRDDATNLAKNSLATIYLMGRDLLTGTLSVFPTVNSKRDHLGKTRALR